MDSGHRLSRLVFIILAYSSGSFLSAQGCGGAFGMGLPFVGPAGGSDFAYVATSGTDCTWDISSNASWIVFTGPTQGIAHVPISPNWLHAG